MMLNLWLNELKSSLLKIPSAPLNGVRDFNYQLMNDLPLSLKQTLRLHANKLYTENELPFSPSEADLLLEKKIIYREQAITRFYQSYYCRRCLNQKQAYFATIDCLRCQQKHVYCRKCISSGRVLACDFVYYLPGVENQYETKVDPQWSHQLTERQEEAALKILTSLKKYEDIIVWAVTGAGKTEMLYEALSYALNKGLKICISSPRTDVIKELEHRLIPVYPSLKIGVFYHNSLKKESDAQLILSTNQQLLRFNQAFDLLIIDEVDAFPYENNPRLQQITKRSRKIKGTTVYLTATPNAKQKRAIKNLSLNSVIIKRRFHGHPLIVPQLIYASLVTLNDPFSLKEFMFWFVNRRNQARRIMIFLPEIALMEPVRKRVYSILKKHGFIESLKEVVTVHSEDEERLEKIQTFRACKTKCIITTTILERGVTFPSVDVCVINADNDVFTQASLIQIAGRAGRSSEDPKGEVIFFSSVRTRAMNRAINEINYMNK